MKEYFDKLIKEYKEASGLKYNNIEYTKWLLKKVEHLENYYDYLTYLGLNKEEKFIEVNKGVLDSISLVTPSNQKVYIISDYAKTFNNKKVKNIEVASGTIKLKQNIPHLVDAGKWIHEIPDDVFSYLFEYPDKRIINDLKMLSYMYKNIYMGIYGNVNDKDKEKRLYNFISFKQDLEFDYNINIDGNYSVVNDTYMYVLKMNPKRK